MSIPLRIAWINLADSATVTASSSVSTLPVGNLASEDIQEVWRATSTTAYLIVDLGSSTSVGIVALIGSNAGLVDAAQVRVSTSDNTGAAGDAYNSGTIATAVDTVFGMFVHPIEPAVSGRYVRIDLTQSSAPEAGRLVVARTWTPSTNFSLVRSWEPLWNDLSRRSFSLSGNPFFDRLPRQRGLRFVLRGLTETEAEDEIHEINRLNGASRDILVCRDVDSANLGKDTFWGPMAVPAVYPETAKGFFEAEFIVWNRL